MKLNIDLPQDAYNALLAVQLARRQQKNPVATLHGIAAELLTYVLLPAPSTPDQPGNQPAIKPPTS